MIPSTAAEHHDRYSVVVLDWPKKEKQDIECYCIPSTNLDGYGCVPAGNQSVEVREHNDGGADARNPTEEHSAMRVETPLESQVKGNKTVWNRLWSRSKSKKQLMGSTRKRRSGDRLKKQELTQEDMQRFISSQDELDWSASVEVAPARPITTSQSTSIVHPLVQIYVVENHEEVDDGISAISNDTSWQDESQGVVELVLPNVLFCDERDDDRREDIDSWNILFPSYVEECLENEREKREEVMARGGEEGHLRDIEVDCEKIKSKEWPDDFSDSDTANVTECESEEEVPPVNVEDEKTLLPENLNVKTTENKEDDIADGSDEISCTASIQGQTEDAKKDLHENSNIEQTENEGDDKANDSESVGSSAERMSSKETVECNTQEDKDATDGETNAVEPIPTCFEAMDEKQLMVNENLFIEDQDTQKQDREEQGKVDKLEDHSLQRMPPSPQPEIQRIVAAPSSPEEISLQQPNGEECPVAVQTPTSNKSHRSGFFRSRRRNSVTKYSLGPPPQNPTCMLEDITVLSESSCSSNITNPSAFSSSVVKSPPSSPSTGRFRAQRRNSVTRYSIKDNSFAVPMYGMKDRAVCGSETSEISSNRVNSAVSVTSTAGSLVKNESKNSAPTSKGVFNLFWSRIVGLTSIFTRRRGDAELEDGSIGSSAIADDGENSASWTAISLDLWGLTEGNEELEESESSNWWELGSSFLVDQVPCQNIPDLMSSTAGGDNETAASNSVAGSCESSPTGFESACMMLKQKFERTVKQYTISSDDPWSAAKRGDVDAIQQWTADKSWDWRQEDEFGNTALFYACHSGAAINITIVKLLLDQWPVDQIPPEVMDRCKLNALNKSVVKMLENPEDAENIIVESVSDLELIEEGDDEETLHLRKWLLYDLEEGEEEEGDY